MFRRDRITFFALLMLLWACGSKKDVESAKHSVYDTDFAIVYSAALEATRELYPNLDDNPGPGRISTAWHQVQYANCAGAGSTCDDMVNPRTVAQQQGVSPNGASPAASMAGMPTRLAYKRYYIRFDVSVAGGRPWRVKVVGHASEWEPGAAMPVELHGIARPHWLEGRTESLQVAIYKRVKKFAVPMKEESSTDTPATAEEPKTDPGQFKNVPAGAAKRLAAIKDSLAKRDYAALRPQIDDNVTWSLGGGTGADAAMAMWQADPAQFDAMAGTLGQCAPDGEQRVKCGASTPASYQLVIEPRGDSWKISSFVKLE